MSDKTITFGGLDLFGLQSLDTTWMCASSSNDDQRSYAMVQDCNGDEVARSGAYDNKNEVSASYRWAGTSGLGAALPKVGAIVGGYVITSVGVESSNDDFPTISLSGHQHDTNAHDTTANEPATFSWPAAITSKITGAFGAYDYLVASDTGSSGAAAASSSITFECDHADVNRADGEHLAGQNYNGRISMSVTYNGAPDAVDTLASYHVTSSAASRGNTEFETVVYNAELGVQRDT